MLNRENLELYLAFVEERHRVWELRQQGAPQPWTEDPVLARHKFTNVFRVLDPGSQFVFELCPPGLDPYDALFRCFLYRYTNEPATWRWIRHQTGSFPTYSEHSPEDVADHFKAYREQGFRVFSGAYVILPQPNRPGDKIVQAVELAYRWMDQHAGNFLEVASSQEQRFTTLRQEYGVGPFMAMQILTDWGYTAQCGEDREHEFVWPGPGAIKGAKAIATYNPRNTIGLMHSMIHLGDDVPVVQGRSPSLMDVQNTLCEFSKYVRFAGKPAGFAKVYRPAHPGQQPAPILPSHWRH